MIMLTLLALLAGAEPMAMPETPDTVFALANHAMSKGAHEEAAARYEQLVAAGVEDGALSYNLGNAYLRQGRLGAAIAAYVHAAALMPRDEDVRANLAFARKQTRDALSPPAPSPVVRTIFFWHFALSAGETALAAALASLVFWSALGVLVVDGRRLVVPARLTAIVAGVSLAALGPSFAVKAVSPRRTAVVTAPEARVHAAHSAEAVVRFVLHEGAEARLVAVEGGWARIELADGQQGWVPGQHVALVDG